MPEFKATIMDRSAVERALKRISHQILEKNNGCDDICIVGIKRRGVSIAKTIADDIFQIEGKPVNTGTLDITFYRDDLSPVSQDPVIQTYDIPFDIIGKKVILVDDVLYTGRTARAGMDALLKFGRAASIQLAVLIDRGHRELPIRGDFVGKNVPTSKSERIFVKIPPFDEETCVELWDEE
ncbi:MAG: bifunctional pyr operon transcriptional regulator/uracil phosphoribosyltransferase PyrR [Acutalibacteraceae bacterium]|nr:bifunctional pyr operon transcriptional regulator/uracil phosphoribosyltransferase PyrR [Acutalibacteraceae bacterium]